MLVQKSLRRILPLSILALSLLAAGCAPAPTLSPSLTYTPFVPASSTALPPSPPPAETLAPSETPSPSPTLMDASSFPDPAGYTWVEVASGLKRPVGVVSSGDGTGRLFLIEQAGRILIHDGDRVLNEAFLDIRGRVGSGGSEQGLLGLAFPPDYAESREFYIDYTDLNGNTVVSRFQTASDPNQADGSSETILLTIPQPFKNHNGGHITFGPDGYLWIAAGDGGSAGDPLGNAQRADNMLGKLLRLDVSQQPYAIPAGNPFGNEIWAYGLRNPWRFSFDPANGDLYIADVGQKQWEEIDYLPAGSGGGSNFGWNFLEGDHPYQGTPPQGLTMAPPIWEYDHSQGCSISGGSVYRGALAEWRGIYIYGDFCSGKVWGLLKAPDGEWVNQLLFSTDRKIAAIDQDQSGEVYLVDLGGRVLKLAGR